MGESLFTQKGFDGFVASLLGTSLVDQWEAHVAKVGDKVFALLGATDGAPRLTFKCTEESFELLTELDGVGQAPYFAKRKWVSVAQRSELSQADISAYLTNSHRLVAAGLTKKKRAELGLG